MSGHNKWSSIKHKKGAADAKRGKIFTRIVKEIILATREGGGDVNMNPRLRTAVANAKENNMPKDNIEKAIKRGTGELEGANYEEYIYEGYGHNGIAIMIEVLTDNKNRTVAELRHMLSKYGGSLAESGAVAWNFEQKGYFEVSRENNEEEEFMMTALDAGAEDIEVADENYEVYTAPADLYKVVSNMEAQGFTPHGVELTRIAKNTINADTFAEKLLGLISKIEDLDDVQKVYANFEISEEIMEKVNVD